MQGHDDNGPPPPSGSSAARNEHFRKPSKAKTIVALKEKSVCGGYVYRVL